MRRIVNDFVTIGEITAPHGVRGEVRVLPLTDFPERFHGLKRVYLRAATKGTTPTRPSGPVEVQSARWHKQFVLMKLHGIDGRDEADKLRRALVQVPVAEAHPLPPDTHYVFQLIGLEVYERDGRKLGVVQDVLATGANDVYVVERAEGEKELLIPALRHVVLNIDLERRRIDVQLLPGLE